MDGNGQRKLRLPKLKNPVKIWKLQRQKNQTGTPEDGLKLEETLEQKEEEEEQLEEISKKLIIREEQLLSQESPNEEEVNQLQTDFEALTLQMWMAVDQTFTSSSSGQLKVLKSVVACIQQQEVQDRRWTDCPEFPVPVWRPQKCLHKHNTLLQKMVESRLLKATEEDDGETGRLSSPLKRKVCWMGKRVKQDLLTVARTVQDCYPPQMDILNWYSGLYHQSFSAQLTELAGSKLEPEDCSYLLFWINHCYPNEILNHEELQGKIKTACLGSLLLEDHLTCLEDQYLTHHENKVTWLNTALEKEEKSWLSSQTPELIDQYCFSPLAVDVIQVMNSCLTEFSCVIRDQRKAQRISAHLESFLSSYQKSVEKFVKGNLTNTSSVIKAHLVCEQQLRDYITSQTESLSEQQRRSCLDTLSALKDCGYRFLTCPIHLQLKVYVSQLWTTVWLDGSVHVIDLLLDCLHPQLTQLTDLKPACRQSLLSVLHQDLVGQYVRRMMKTKMRSKEQQVGGAQRMTEDAQKINEFFSQQGCTESLWLGEVLCSLAEVLRVQDPGCVHLEVVSLARRFTDLSDAHVAALLNLKNSLSAADIRSIRRSVEENRLLDVSTNQSPQFFSKVKIKWIKNKINQMGL